MLSCRKTLAVLQEERIASDGHWHLRVWSFRRDDTRQREKSGHLLQSTVRPCYYRATRGHTPHAPPHRLALVPRVAKRRTPCPWEIVPRVAARRTLRPLPGVSTTRGCLHPNQVHGRSRAGLPF